MHEHFYVIYEYVRRCNGNQKQQTRKLCALSGGHAFSKFFSVRSRPGWSIVEKR